MSQSTRRLTPAADAQRLFKQSPIDPKSLSAGETDALARELYAVHQEIFGGVTEADFRAYVVDSPAARTRIQVYRAGDADGPVVGFAAVHVFELELDDGPMSLMRAEVGLMEGWRGRSAAAGFLLREGLRVAALSPVRRACFLACPVHPASYLALTRSCGQVWPRPEAPTPAPIQAVMDRLDSDLGLQRPADAADDGVRKVGWITRQTPSEARFWAGHSDERVRYYIERNPGYRRGDGLLVLAPVDWRSVLDGALGTARRKLSRAWRTLGRLPFPALPLLAA